MKKSFGIFLLLFLVLFSGCAAIQNMDDKLGEWAREKHLLGKNYKTKGEEEAERKEKKQKQQEIGKAAAEKWAEHQKTTEKRKMRSKPGDRTAADLIANVNAIGEEAINQSRCIGSRWEGPRGGHSSAWVTTIMVCQKIVQSSGFLGIDCNTCSGNFTYYNFEFSARDGNILLFKGILENGMQISFHHSVLTVLNPSTGHFISYTTENLSDQKIISKESGKVDYTTETEPIKIHVTNVHLPVEVQSSLVSFYKGQKFDFKETYAVIDSVYQKASAIGIDPVQFAFDLITQPGQLLQRLKAEEIAGKENGK